MSEKTKKKAEENQHHSEPDIATLESELERERYKTRYRSALQSTIFTLITVAAVAVLVATLWMPVLQIYGSSMNPGISAGDIVVCRKADKVKRGDVVAFYFNNKILVKRVLGTSGDQITISDDGVVTVNGETQQEPYVTRLALGQCNVSFPLVVPQGKVFVIGDNRESSVDSRNSSIGCVDVEQLIGKLLVRVWPADSVGLVR